MPNLPIPDPIVSTVNGVAYIADTTVQNVQVATSADNTTPGSSIYTVAAVGGKRDQPPTTKAG